MSRIVFKYSGTSSQRPYESIGILTGHEGACIGQKYTGKLGFSLGYEVICARTPNQTYLNARRTKWVCWWDQWEHPCKLTDRFFQGCNESIHNDVLNLYSTNSFRISSLWTLNECFNVKKSTASELLAASHLNSVWPSVHHLLKGFVKAHMLASALANMAY